MSVRVTKQSGFTLVEMLIALFIFALISVGTMAALTNTIRGKSEMGERLSTLQDIQSARALLKADFSNIILRPKRDSYGGVEPYVLSGGVNTLVDFTRSGRPNPGGLEARSDLQRVSYVFEDGQLIRRSLAHENPAPRTPKIDRVLLSDLVRANMSFVLEKEKRQQVFLTLDSEIPQEPPKGIELELEFSNGDRLVQYFEVAL